MSKRVTIKGLVMFASLSVLFSLLHVADDIVRGDGGFTANSLALMAVILSTVYVFGIGWTWKERRYGYAILLVLSVFPMFFGTFLSHLGVVGDDLATIGASYPEVFGVGTFFVFVSLAGGLTSLTTLLLAIYILAVPKKT